MREDALYRLDNEDTIPSPALIYYAEIIESNTRLAIEMAGGANRLWPHVKTHKMAELIDMQISMGITRFKCATIAELRMVLSRGAKEVLLAYPLVGPNIDLFLDAARDYPSANCYALGDSLEALEKLDRAAAIRGMSVQWLCDVNMGMNRTGVPTRRLAQFLTEAVKRFTRLRLMGLHCYDGHNHQPSFEDRLDAASNQMARVESVRMELSASGISTPIVIAGGSPSFPCHSREEGAYLSPGTVFLWDWGYQTGYRDLKFVPAAALLTRVISHPEDGLFTLDLGCKAIATDPAGQRGHLLDVPGALPVLHSEEHWTWRMPEGLEKQRPAIGRTLYVIPTHICPTTALYNAVTVARGNHACGVWKVAARDRIMPN